MFYKLSLLRHRWSLGTLGCMATADYLWNIAPRGVRPPARARRRRPAFRHAFRVPCFETVRSIKYTSGVTA